MHVFFVYVEVWHKMRGEFGGDAFRGLQEAESPSRASGRSGWGCRSNLLSAKTNTCFFSPLLTDGGRPPAVFAGSCRPFAVL